MIKNIKWLLATMTISLSTFASEPTTVANVDLKKYMGLWYEIASIPQSFQKQCVGNTTAEYSLLDNGKVKVMNTCDTKSGKRSVAEGRAKIVDTKTNSKLKVTFVKLIDWVFTFGGDYWILDLAPDYSYALIGDPSREYAWILSRTPNLSSAQLKQIELKFKEQGYDTSKILTSIQKNGFQERKPLNLATQSNLDIIDTALNAGQFQTLLSSIQLAGLEETLRSNGSFTVFAPTDAAFAKLSESDIQKITTDISLLQQVLTYHVVSGFVTANDLKNMNTINTVLNKSLIIQNKQDGLYINNSKVIVTDVLAKNGVIHVIDTVLNPAE